MQVEIEVQSSAKSVLISTDEGPTFCFDTSLAGTRVGAFHNGDLSAPYPIEVGVHKIEATAFFLGEGCTTGPGTTETLKLVVSFGGDNAEDGCT